jgi:hypothetical protein
MKQVEDETEQARREMIKNGVPEERLKLATKRWTTEELVKEFDVLRFLAPFVIARRKSDHRIGSLEFTHEPRFYFNWTEQDDEMKEIPR